jgi:lysophospholipase L1-like esterase
VLRNRHRTVRCPPRECESRLNGTDPDFHSKPQFVQQSVLFAASGHGTGLYVSLSCAYHTTAEAPVPVDVLGGVGTFMTQSVGTSFCPVNAHIVARHPSLGGLDDAYMSGWSCSAHEGFTQWPANFSPLVIITDASTNPYTASDGTRGLVYVLASGARTAGLSLTPRSASAVPGSAHTVIARQADSSDAPQAGVTLSFAVTSGPNAGGTGACRPATCVSDAAGQVSWTYTGGPGSGADSIVAFQDTNGNGVPDLGEPQTTSLMTWDPALGTYVALGDSFSSGEGNPPFDTTPSDTNTDGCHRSYLAYPHVAWAHTLAIPTNAAYWACSGAPVSSLTGPFKGERAQLSHVNSSTTLVTLTLGGNDAYFDGVLTTCVAVPCAKLWDKKVSDQITLLGTHSAPGSLYQAYRKVKTAAAPNARVLVLGYPRFFPVNGSGGLGCSLVLNGDERWINQKLHDVDAVIRESAAAAGVEYVDTEDAFNGHELCSGNGTPTAVNSARLPKEYSFHPNALGHQLLALAVETKLTNPAGTYFDILPLAAVSSTHTVAAGTGSTAFTSSWPGSDVQLTLTSPTGATYDRSTTDSSVLHTLTPTSETYQVTDPAPGQWTATLYGANVAFAGEPTSLSVQDTPKITPDPVASFTQSARSAAVGAEVTFDASGSTATATLGSYEWDFGDGTTATGIRAGHSYAAAGTYVPQLVVTDSAGGHGVTDGDPIIVGTIPPPPVPSGDAVFYGSVGGTHLNEPVVGMAVDPATGGYWLVASDGGIFSFHAPFHGSTGGIHLNQPIVGMAATPDGKGYWLVAKDGGIFSFGDAGFYGSTGAIHLNQPIVGMAATPDGKGYWLVAKDGGIFSFGPGAHFYGSTGAIHLNQPIVGMASAPKGDGYRLIASDGGIFSFGLGARFHGSTAAIHLNQPIVGMAAAPDKDGYWLVAADGGIFMFGNVGFYGSTGAIHLNQPVVGMATTTDGRGYYLAASDGGIFAL